MKNPNNSIYFETIDVVGHKQSQEKIIGRHNPLIVNMDHVIHFHKDNYLKYFADQYDKIEVRFRGESRALKP